MDPVFSVNTGAGIAFYSVIGVFLLLELRVRVRSRLNREGSHQDRISFLVVYASVTGGIVGGFLLAGNAKGAVISVGRWELFVAGIVLMVFGIVVRQWSVATLGRFFTVDVRVFPDQKVIDGGPYRWVAHPSYTGMILTLGGIGLALGNWAALAVLVALPSAWMLVSIRFEERLLSSTLGEPYRRFLAQRRHLFPGLW